MLPIDLHAMSEALPWLGALISSGVRGGHVKTASKGSNGALNFLRGEESRRISGPTQFESLIVIPRRIILGEQHIRQLR